jgi:hypothetical protein
MLTSFFCSLKAYSPLAYFFLSVFLKGNKEGKQGRYYEQGENRGDG